MIILEIILAITLVTILLLISVSDNVTSIIPNSFSAILLGIAGCYYFLNLKNGIWWLPLVSSLGLFIIFFLLFLITGEGVIGGGDMKVICISLLFLNNYNLVFNYIIWNCFFTFLGALNAKIKEEKSLRCGPYLSLALLCTIRPENVSLLVAIMLSILFAITIIFLREIFYRKEITYDIQKN